MNVSFELLGTQPLLFHADDVEASDNLKEWRSHPDHREISVPGDDRSPSWTWHTYLYHHDGVLAWPSANLMTCLRSAATQIIMKKQKTFKEVSQSGLLIRDEFLGFEVPGIGPVSMDDISAMHSEPFKIQAEKVKNMGFCLYVKRAKVGTNKHVRVRARFNKWSISGKIEILSPAITYEILERMFDAAGRVGLGDWRPGCKTPGPFGMFEAKLKRTDGKMVA